jgi:hypothetical protein
LREEYRMKEFEKWDAEQGIWVQDGGINGRVNKIA